MAQQRSTTLPALAKLAGFMADQRRIQSTVSAQFTLAKSRRRQNKQAKKRKEFGSGTVTVAFLSIKGGQKRYNHREVPQKDLVPTVGCNNQMLLPMTLSPR